MKGPSLSFFQSCSLSFVTSDIVCSPLQVHLRTNRRGQGCMDGNDIRAKPHGLQSVPSGTQIGRESFRERVCQDVEISVVAVTLKKKTRDIRSTFLEHKATKIT